MRFSCGHVLFLLYAQPMFDVLTEARESPPRRVPEQLGHVGSTVAPRVHGNGQQDAQETANMARPLRPYLLWAAAD
jgi:hypothetical protein